MSNTALQQQVQAEQLQQGLLRGQLEQCQVEQSCACTWAVWVMFPV